MVSRNIDIAVEHGAGFRAGGVGFGVKIVVLFAQHDARLLHSRYCRFVVGADVEGVRKDSCFTGHGQLIAGGFGVVLQNHRDFLTDDSTVRCKLVVSNTLNDAFLIGPFHVGQIVGICYYIRKATGLAAAYIYAGESAEGGYKICAGDGSIRLEFPIRAAAEQPSAGHIVNGVLRPMGADVCELC